MQAKEEGEKVRAECAIEYGSPECPGVPGRRWAGVQGTATSSAPHNALEMLNSPGHRSLVTAEPVTQFWAVSAARYPGRSDRNTDDLNACPVRAIL